MSAIGAGIGAFVGTGLGAWSAYSQQHDARKAVSAEWDASLLRINRAAAAAAEQRAAQTRAAQQLLGRIRVAAGATGNTLDSVSQQALADVGRNKAVINANFGSAVQDIQLGFQAFARQLLGSTPSILMSSIQGGLAGAAAGSGIGGAVGGGGGAGAAGGGGSDLAPIWAKYGQSGVGP